MAEKSQDRQGEKYNVRASAPSHFSSQEIAACIAIVKRGHAVNPKSAEVEIPEAKVLGIARTVADIVGVGAIKQIRTGYASGVAKKSGFSFDPKTPELGYVAVEAAHRGNHLSVRIVAELLLDYQGSLFATTSNEAMKRTLTKAGFVKKGREWAGRKGQLSLWIKD